MIRRSGSRPATLASNTARGMPRRIACGHSPARQFWKLAAAARIAAHRAREELIPGAIAAGETVDDDLELAVVAREVRPRPGPCHELAQSIGEQYLGSRCVVLPVVGQSLEMPAKQLGVALGRAVRRALDQGGALGQLEPERLPGRLLLEEAGTPAGEQIAPGLDGVEIPCVAAEQETADPVADRCDIDG